MEKFKVSLLKVSDYNNIKSELIKGFKLLGGVSDFFKPTEKILLKPNLLRAVKPEKAVTTHPEIIKAFIDILLDHNCIPIIGDSPGIGTAEKVLEKLDLMEFLKKRNIKLANTKEYFKKEISINKQKYFFNIWKGVKETDKIVSLAKLKSHAQMLYTGAIKNIFGCVYGIYKPELHYKFPDYKNFADMIVYLNIALKPNFTIIDGIVGMEGNGPSAGTPVKLNSIILSDNLLSADIVAAKIINYIPKDIPILKSAIENNMGPNNINDIEILGDNISKLINTNFKKIIKTSSPGNILPMFNKIYKKYFMTKPIVDHKNCIKCKKCIDVCFSKAISLSHNKIKFNYNKCIRCYCCQEMCPVGTINLKNSILMNFTKKTLDFLS